MEDFLKDPTIVATGTTLGIGFPLLLLYIRGWLPTRTQDQEKSREIERLQKQIDAKDAIIASLPTVVERDNLLAELATVKNNARNDLSEKQKQVDSTLRELKDMYQTTIQQQEAVHKMTETLADLTKNLPLLVFTIERLLKEKDHG